MPKFLQSATVIGGAIIAATNGLAYEGYISGAYAEAISSVLAGIVVLLRYRKGAGKALRKGQE